jgi:hypothetical protein
MPRRADPFERPATKTLREASDAPNLAVLFWYFADFELCENRLQVLRTLNPSVPIYGLFGGPRVLEDDAREHLGRLLDDFYAFDEDRQAAWKWRHGDRLIAAWHRDRGVHLAWDTIVIVQWDMLVLAPLARLFAQLRKGEALFSGDRPASEVRAWWGWLCGDDREKREDAEAFVDLMHDEHGYRGDLWCCLFIVVALPRRFLDLYMAAGPPEPGFLEYKLPTIARCFGTPVADASAFQPWWAADPASVGAPARRRSLNAGGHKVSVLTVLSEALRYDGRRIFHPFCQFFPPSLARLLGRWDVTRARSDGWGLGRGRKAPGRPESRVYPRAR